MLADARLSTNDGRDVSESELMQVTVYGEGMETWGEWQVTGGALVRDREWSLGGSAADNRLVRGNLSPRLRFGSKTTFLQCGVDLLRDRVDHTDHLAQNPQITVAWAELERLTTGAYLFGGKKLGRGLSLSGGIRLELARTDNLYVHYRRNQLLPVLETNRGEFPNPDYRNPPEPDPDLSFEGMVEKSGWAAEFSLLQKVNEFLVVWAGWDRVYRYPSLDESAAYQGYPLGEPLNARLEPETGHNFEAGIKASGPNWHAGLTIFLLRLDDEISYVEQTGADGEEIRLNRNVGDSQRHGLELDFSYQKDRYGISMNASWTEAELRGEGGQLPLVPRMEGGVTGWIRPAPPVRLQAHFRYLGEQVQGNDFDREFRKMDPYSLVGVSVRLEPMEGLVVEASAMNLLDRTYAMTAYNGGFYPGPGRHFSLRAEVTF
jgi:outer membrane receptor protein involved in Fe transport